MGLEGILSVLATTLSAINRVPQALFVYKNWSVTGINKTSLILECWSYSIVISYSIYFNYSTALITSYLPLLVQDTFMFYLIFKIESSSSNKELKRFIFASIFIHSVICSKILPAWIPITILTASSPAGISSRILQIHSIVKSGNPGQVSALSSFLKLLTCCCRLSLIATINADWTLMGRLIIQIFLHGILALTILYYRKSVQIEKNRKE